MTQEIQKGGQIVIGNVLAPGENRSGIPDHVIESLARCFLPDLIAFFESDERKREYEEWERNQGNVSDINVA